MLLSAGLLRPRRYVVRPPDLQYLVPIIERTAIDAVRREPVRFLRSCMPEIGRSVQVGQFQGQLNVLTLLQTDREMRALFTQLGSSSTQLLGNLIAPTIALLLVKSLDLPSEATSFLTKTVDTFLTRLRKGPSPPSTTEAAPVPIEQPRPALRSANESARRSRRRDR
jgi:hypothetical protein